MGCRIVLPRAGVGMSALRRERMTRARTGPSARTDACLGGTVRGTAATARRDIGKPTVPQGVSA